MRVVKLTSLNIVFPKYFQTKKKKERGSQLFRKICCCLIDPHRGVFRNQSNVYGGGFLQKQLIDFSLTIFAKGSNIDVGLGLELVSEINMTTKMTTSKKLFNDVKTTIHRIRGHSWLSNFYHNRNSVGEGKQRAYLKIFYTKLHTHFMLTLANILRTKNEYFSKKNSRKTEYFLRRMEVIPFHFNWCLRRKRLFE